MPTGFVLARTTVALGVFGQSNERGNVPLADAAAYPRAFTSLRKPGTGIPYGPSVTRLGSWWPKVVDDLWDWGYDVQVVNGALGGLSFVTQAAGYAISSRVSNTVYNVQRVNTGYPDRGDFGDIFTVAGRYYNVTSGGQVRAAMNAGPLRNSNGFNEMDNVAWVGGGATAGSLPNAYGGSFTGDVTGSVLTVSAIASGAISVGQVIYNGATAVGTVASLGTGAGGTGTYNLTSPVTTASTALTSAVAIGATVVDGTVTVIRLNEALYTTTNLGVCTDAGQGGRGFDPLGAIFRLHEAMQRVQADRKIIYIANGQGDLGTGSGTYGAAVQEIAAYFLRRFGYEVMIGLTMYSPASGGSTPTNYGNLGTGVTNAISNLNSLYPGRVYAGANLYTDMGTTGPMASGGAFFTGTDNIHLNGAGAVGPAVSGVESASFYIGNKIKAVLPKLTTVDVI